MSSANEVFLIVTSEISLEESYRKTLISAGVGYTPNFSMPTEEGIVQLMASKEPTVILIDSVFGLKSEQDLFSDLRQATLNALESALQHEEYLPLSLRIVLDVCEYRRSWKLESLLIFYLIDNPSPALTQTLLKAGVDWVWTPRLDSTDLVGVVQSLRAIRFKLPMPTIRPLVLVVENSSEACIAIKTNLASNFELSFVGEEKPEYDFANITPSEAITAFQRLNAMRTISGLIVDLALTNDSERDALKYFASNEAAKQKFIEMKSQGDQEMLSIFGGLAVIQEIRKVSPDVVIAILSNWVRPANVLDVIREVLGLEVFKSVDIFSKSPDQLSEMGQTLFKKLHLKEIQDGT